MKRQEKRHSPGTGAANRSGPDPRITTKSRTPQSRQKTAVPVLFHRYDRTIKNARQRTAFSVESPASRHHRGILYLLDIMYKRKKDLKSKTKHIDKSKISGMMANCLLCLVERCHCRWMQSDIPVSDISSYDG